MDDKVEVVISGAAGMFPECKNIPELEEALFSKLHLITDDKRKWKHGKVITKCFEQHIFVY